MAGIRQSMAGCRKRPTESFATVVTTETLSFSTHRRVYMKSQNALSPVAVAQKYFDSLASGDLATLGSLLAEDIVWHQPGKGSLSKTYHGKAEVFALFGKFMTISEGSFRIDSVANIMANGDLVSATLHFQAQKANGQAIAMNGVDLMKIQNGLISEMHLFSADISAEDAFWG